MLVIARLEEIDQPGLDVQFGPELADQLHSLDYQHKFAIVVLRGLLGVTNMHYTVDILQVTRYGKRVVLKTHFGEPGPDEGALMALSSPYHAIAVSKEGAWGTDIRFVLEVDGRKVKEHVYFVP